MNENTEVVRQQDRKKEWQAFAVIAIFLFPLLTIVGAGGYGFIIWMLQLVFGPPGHG